MAWKVEISKTAHEQFREMDVAEQKRLLTFLHKKLDGIEDPRTQGKALRGAYQELWRYRVGDYRIICQSNDDIVTVLVLAVGHRKEIYHSDVSAEKVIH